MKLKFNYSLLSFLLFGLCYNQASAQFVNNGSTIIIQNGVILTVNGDFNNNSGSIINLGLITLTGNWSNGDPQGAFNIGSTGSVNLIGANQTIGGTQKTIFPNVNLLGTGIKTLNANIDINGVINLNDRQLALASQNLEILNTSANSILFSTGFISSDAKGTLYRRTNTTADYIYPMGSLLQGSLRYRPIIVSPKENLNNTYGVSFINDDPNLDGLNRQAKRPDVAEVNPLYYHILDQRVGASFANFRFLYNTTEDGNANQLVNWIRFNLWEKAGISNPEDLTTVPNINKLMTFSSLERISKLPMALAIIGDNNNPITFYNSFSPDGDGINDRWEIRNIDLFPDNELSILNRWGSEIYRAKNYSNANAWDGLGLNNGTYFYVLKVVVNNEPKVYKGFISLLKK
jgi:gliding motility-associated-like protein